MKDIANAPGRYVSKLGGRIRIQLDSIASECGITQAQGRTLQYIASRNRTVYQKDIEEEYGLRAATASQMLQSMEDAGLIRREVDEQDRRKKRIVVSEEKREASVWMLERIAEMEAQMVEGIAPEKLAVFTEVIEQMIQNLSQGDRSIPLKNLREGSEGPQPL